MTDHRQRTQAASTGLPGTEAGFLDLHFEACRADYEAMLHSVGLQSGWRVLDAACGAGSFLPLIAERVGPTGSIGAFDLAPDNVAAVERRVAQWQTSCSVEAKVGNLTAPPYPDESFDAVWCANSVQYLTDDELTTALAEFCRVVRPDGLVAIKEADIGLWFFEPADPELLWRLWGAGRRLSAQIRGFFRARSMHNWLERAGLVDVWHDGTLTVIRPPLQPVQREYLAAQFLQWGAFAEQFGVPEADLQFWRSQRDSTSAEHLLNHPDLVWCEGHFVTVGRVNVHSA